MTTPKVTFLNCLATASRIVLAAAYRCAAAKAAPLPPIFAAACYPSAGTRYEMDKPFVRGGHVYATNGCLIVRMPTDAADTAPDRFPPTAQLPLNRDLFAPDPISLPALPPEWWETSSVDGLPVMCERGIVLTPSVALASFYIRLLKEHGVDRVYGWAIPNRHPVPVYFTFNGGDGLLMPCNGEATPAEYEAMAAKAVPQ